MNKLSKKIKDKITEHNDMELTTSEVL